MRDVCVLPTRGINRLAPKGVRRVLQGGCALTPAPHVGVRRLLALAGWFCGSEMTPLWSGRCFPITTSVDHLFWPGLLF